MDRLGFVLVLFLLIGPRVSEAVTTPAACNGMLNKTITGAENLLNSPEEAQQNTWRRCHNILSAKHSAALKAIRAKRQAWLNSQNQNP